MICLEILRFYRIVLKLYGPVQAFGEISKDGSYRKCIDLCQRNTEERNDAATFVTGRVPRGKLPVTAVERLKLIGHSAAMA